LHEPFRHNDEKCGGNGPTRFLGVDREAIRRLSPDALEGYWYADALAKRDRERREAALQGDLMPPSSIEKYAIERWVFRLDVRLAQGNGPAGKALRVRAPAAS